MKLIALFASLLVSALVTAAAFDQHTLGRVKALAYQHNAEAQYHVGMLYTSGVGGATADPQLAFEWFLKAAEGNDPLGAYQAGCYFSGQIPGVVEVNADKALDLKLMAAEAGYAPAQADVALIFYQRGDVARAQLWWRRAADQGSDQAAYHLARIYYIGKEVPQDLPQAYAWFKLSKLIVDHAINARTQAALNGMAATMKASEREAAERAVAAWRAHPSALTEKARNGDAAIDALLKSHPM